MLSGRENHVCQRDDVHGDSERAAELAKENELDVGDAGCIVTNDDHLADWAAAFARHGGKGEHLMEGICSRMDGLQAAILNVKLPHLPAWIEARRRVAVRYDELLREVGDVVTPKVAPDRDHVYHLYVIRTGNRDALRKHLTDAGVATVLNYPKALPFYPAYAYLGYVPEDFPVAYANQSRILSIPIYPEMGKETIVAIVEQIDSFFAGKKAGPRAPVQPAVQSIRG